MEDFLTERENNVLWMSKHLSLKYIAKIYGVTEDKVRFVRDKAREKIRVLTDLSN